MEPLGFVGIIRLSSHIVSSNLKHFLSILCLYALFNALPRVLTALSYGNTSPASIASQLLMSLQSIIARGNQLPSQPQAHIPPSLLLPLLFFCSIFTLVVIQPLVTFSVCRAVHGKSLALKGSLQGVPRSAPNLLLTILCEVGVLFGVIVVAALILMLITVSASLLGMDQQLIIWICISWAVIMTGLFWYVGIQWSLATTVAIVEEKRGWEAIKRSTYLVDGSKKMVLLLGMVAIVCQESLSWAGAGSSGTWRWSFMVVSISVEMIIGLFTMTCMAVLYMSCKARFKEPVDSLTPLGSQFGPQEAVYMDLEAARLESKL